MYQGLVYVVCAELDHSLGRHVSMGTGTLADEDCLLKAIRQLTQERDAVLSALKEISEADTWLTQQNNEAVSPWVIEVAKKALSGNPSAALAERDRAIEKRTAERCAEIAHGMYPAGWCREKILREFNLEPKSEGVVAFFGTWPGDETDKELHDAAKDIL